MPTRDTAWPAGTPSWVDLSATDIDKAAEFYAAVFGWEVQPGSPEFGGYRMCVRDGRAVAGLGPKQGPPEAPSAWTTYLSSTDTDATVAAITKAGGQVPMEPMDVADLGRMAIAFDPAGAVFGIWQAMSHIGAGLVNEPGTQVWNEQLSNDFAGSKEFYGSVFGYSFNDMSSDGFSYATLDLDGRPAGGIGAFPPDAPAGVPAHWMTYFAVTDTDTTLREVTHLGGTVAREPWDTPFGRMATVTDNQGATFSIIAMPA